MSVATTKECPSKFTSVMIPARTWVVFDVQVPWSREKWQWIYGEWFPTSGYEEVGGHKIQVGPEIKVGVKQVATEEVAAQLWIPITKKI